MPVLRRLPQPRCLHGPVTLSSASGLRGCAVRVTPIFEDQDVALSIVSTTLNLGFLTIVHENGGYVGGYLVTNPWGRPLEFRLSSPVQPNRIQQILYGGTLQPYLCADLIGKTLIEKTGTAAQCIFTDCEAALDLRLCLDVPVIWLAPSHDPVAEDLADEGSCVRPSLAGENLFIHHPCFPSDRPIICEILEHIDTGMELSEPFARIRQALTEARKMGVTSRA